jgi:hypothetical protein
LLKSLLLGKEAVEDSCSRDRGGRRCAVWWDLYFHSRPATPLTEKDTVVLADFDNKTGDAVFDDALKQALAVQLDNLLSSIFSPTAR